MEQGTRWSLIRQKVLGLAKRQVDYNKQRACSLFKRNDMKR